MTDKYKKSRLALVVYCTLMGCTPESIVETSMGDIYKQLSNAGFTWSKTQQKWQQTTRRKRSLRADTMNGVALIRVIVPNSRVELTVPDLIAAFELIGYQVLGQPSVKTSEDSPNMAYVYMRVKTH